MIRFYLIAVLLFAVSVLPVTAQDKSADALNSTSTASALPIVQALIDQAKVENANKKTQSAWKIYETALAKARELHDSMGEVICLTNMGVMLKNGGKPDQALTYYQQSLQIARNDHFTDMEKKSLLNIARAHLTLKHYALTLTALQQVQSLCSVTHDREKQASAIRCFGETYQAMNQNQNALKFYHDALAYYQETDDKKIQAEILWHQGDAYRSLGQFQNAIQSAYQAVQLYEQLGNKDRAAHVLISIGGMYYELGQYRKATELYSNSAKLFRQSGSQEKEVSALNMAAIARSAGGELQKALEYYQSLLSIYRQMGNKAAQARLLGNIAYLHAKQKQTDKAADVCRQALQIYKALGSEKGECDILTLYGQIYTESQPSKALTYLQQALSLAKKRNDSNEIMFVKHHLGYTYQRLEQYQLSLTCFQQVLKMKEEAGEQSSKADTIHWIASNLSLLGRDKDAAKFISVAVALKENFRAGLGNNTEINQGFLADNIGTYRSMVVFLDGIEQQTQALHCASLMKGRTLFDQMHRKDSLLKGVSAQAQVKLHQLRARCEQLAFAAELQSSRSVTAQIKADLKQSENAMAIEQDRLIALYPGAAQRNLAAIPSVSEVAAILPNDTAVLEFVSGESSQLVFILTIENKKPLVSSHWISLPQTELTERAESLRDACADPKKGYKVAAKELAGKLLPPAVMKRLAGKKRLVICPDGATWSVPFAALVLPDGKHLIEKYELAYAYSATGAHAALTVPRSKTSGGMLAVANPEFGDETRFGEIKPLALMADASDKARNRPLSDPARGVLTQRGGITALPGTQAEADALAKLYPEATIVTGTKVQEAEIVKELPKYRYLHFATHGLFSDTAPLQSAIVLGQPPNGSEEDGFLTARELMEVNLNAEMAVLSACETARGVNKEGEGVVGLTWALFAAGVPTQVVSQWKVSDASTPKLMAAFYGNLKSGQGKGKALRNAALMLMQDKAHSHPYHWASFVLFGDWR